MIRHCENHYGTEGTELCSICYRHFCESCVVRKGKKIICSQCRAHNKYKNIATVSVFVVFFLGLMILALLGSSTFQSYKRAWMLSWELRADPCNVEKVDEIALLYSSLNKNKKALGYTEKFLKDCEEIYDIRARQFSIHKAMKDYGSALKDVDVLLEDEPYDKDFWVWKGEVYEQMGDYDLAIQHYRESIKLVPGLIGLPLNLVDLYRKSKRYCEAYQELERYTSMYPEIRYEDKIKYMFEDLSKPGRCKPSFSEGSATIQFAPGGKEIMAVVTFNDSVSGTFLVDTGASQLTLNKSFAEKIVLLDEKKSAIFSTANGFSTGYVSTVAKVALKGVSSTYVPVAITENDLPDADGMLGMSFLSRFQVEIDSQKGIMKLKHKSFSAKD